jgi:hypothetical protein
MAVEVSPDGFLLKITHCKKEYLSFYDQSLQKFKLRHPICLHLLTIDYLCLTTVRIAHPDRVLVTAIRFLLKVKEELAMLVKIMYQNDTLGEVEPFYLDELIYLNQIKKILRSDGWAPIATAAIRSRRRRYEGPQRNFQEAVREEIDTEFAVRNLSDIPNPFAEFNVGHILERSRQNDASTVYCPGCGKKCEEIEILDGSSAGIILLMKCTNFMCGKYFEVAYEDRSLPESILSIRY